MQIVLYMFSVLFRSRNGVYCFVHSSAISYIAQQFLMCLMCTQNKVTAMEEGGGGDPLHPPCLNVSRIVKYFRIRDKRLHAYVRNRKNVYYYDTNLVTLYGILHQVPSTRL